MKPFVFFTFFLFISFSVLSTQVDSLTALNVAKNYSYHFFNKENRTEYKDISPTIEEIWYSNDNKPLLYFINVNPTGYLIISGDNRCIPVLSYTEDERWTENQIESLPPGAQFFIQGYAEQIQIVLDTNITAVSEVEQLWALYKDTIQLNLKNTLSTNSIQRIGDLYWSQRNFYNDICPQTSVVYPSCNPLLYDGRCLAGCVAVAMSQIMRYWQWPPWHDVIVPYTDPSNGSYSATDQCTGLTANFPSDPSHGTQSASTSVLYYEYENMDNQISSQNIDVASLIRDAGVAVEMDYSYHGSSAYDSDALDAFEDVFRYSSDAELKNKTILTSWDTWEDDMKIELEAQRPIYYSGQNQLILGSGHAFICWAFQEEINYSKFKFNWGWAGSYNNTWYTVREVTGVTQIEYDVSQSMITNIFPDMTNFQPCLYQRTISGTGSTESETYIGGGTGYLYTSTNSPCGYQCPGIEQVYIFVAPSNGTYSIQVTNSSLGYVDFMWKNGGCSNSTGWNCISRVNSTGQYGTLNWTAGTTYYILLDDEDETPGLHTFYINTPITPDPCTSITNISGTGVGNTQTFLGGGNGSWFNSSNNPCNYPSPGEEKIFSFTPTVTGNYNIQVTAASGFVDYLWKTGSCSNSGWDCIDDVNSTGQIGPLSWTAGTTYYILLDDEDGNSGFHSFYIVPPPVPYLSVANSTIPTTVPYGGGNYTLEVTNTGSGALSWNHSGNASWISYIFPGSGSTSSYQTVDITIDPNSGSSSRNSSITFYNTSNPSNEYIVNIYQAGVPAPTADWESFYKDASNTGYQNTSLNTNVGIEWEVNSSISSYSAYCGPVIANNKIVIAGSGGVYCYNMDGSLNWSNTSIDANTFPAIHNNYLYVADEQGSGLGKLYAMDLNTGFIYAQSSGTAPFEGVITVTDNNNIFVPCEFDRIYSFSFNGNSISLNWYFNSYNTSQIGKHLEYRRSGVAVYGSYVYLNGVTQSDDELYGIKISKSNGSYSTHFLIQDPSSDIDICNTPVYYNSRIYFTFDVGSTGILKCVNTSLSGQWSYNNFNDYRITAPVCYNSKVYVGDDDGYVYCLNATSGNYIFDDDYGSDIEKGMAITNNCLVALSKNELHLINLTNGSVIEDISVGSSSYGPPAVVGNKIILTNTSEDIYCISNVFPPEADFSASPTSGSPPLAVNFTDQSNAGSSSITGRVWNFGDGSSSTLTNPSHTYNLPGQYTVSLTVNSSSGSDTKEIINYITVDDDPIISFLPTNHDFGNVTENNCSASSTFILVNSGGGTATGSVSLSSSEFNIISGGSSFSLTANQTKLVVVEFCPTNTGAITGSLNATGNSPTNSTSVSLSGTGLPSIYTISGYVKESNNTPIPGVTVSFSNSGGNVLTDYTGYYEAQVNGGYTGIATPSKSNWTFTPTSLSYSNVSSNFTNQDYVGETIIADFSASPTNTYTSTNVLFSDLSTGSPTSWLWSFGDGATSVIQNPSHSYSTAGIYTISLEVANAYGSDTEIKYDYIVINSAITITAVGNNVSCFGGSNGSINTTVTGGTSPLSYVWSSGATTQNISNLIAGTYSVTVTDAVLNTNSESVSITQPNEIMVTVNDISNYLGYNVSCFDACDGYIEISVSGGTPPYQYNWDNGYASSEDVIGLCAGNHTLVITDADSCVVTASFSITEPPLLTITSNVSDISCFGGQDGVINITVTGGMPPYSYIWDDGSITEDRSGLTAGTYTVTVTDANICSVTTSVTLTTTPPTGLIAYYPFNNNVNDESGNGNDGTSVGGVSPTIDRCGNLNSAIEFDGLNNTYIDIGPLMNFTDSFTFTSWNYLQSNLPKIWYTFFNSPNYTSDFGIMYNMLDTFIRIYNQGGNGVHDIAIELPIEEWFMFTFTYDGNEMKTYIDTVLIDTFNYSTDLHDNGNFVIGATYVSNDTTYIWYGKMDEIRFYDKPLIANEIQALYSPCPSQSFVCGDSISDIDGNYYNTVLIGYQCWMKENLNTTHDASGNSITRHCYNNETDSCDVYGGLYDWNTLMNGASSSNAVPSGVQGICPSGWHVPSNAEWDTIVNYLGGNYVAGGKMKEAGILHWLSPNTDATNSSGFTGLPGGYRSSGGSFYNLYFSGYWWSSAQYSSNLAWRRLMTYSSGSVYQYDDSKSGGCAVRCLKDSFLFVYLPILQTDSITGITTNAAFGGGEILDSGGDSITARGLCWNTTGSPTLADSFVVAGSGTGTFTAQLTNLLPGTIYYVRAFATNLVGTGYGNEIQFTILLDTTGSFTCGDQISDYDGNLYNTVLIGTQCWMKENLNTTHDAAGNSIIRYCYNNETDSCDVYGGLYDWNTLMNGASSSNSVPSGVQGICPSGWHVPSDAEWDTVVAFLGGISVAGGKMKEAGFTHWHNPNFDATNSSGFSALPGGGRGSSGSFYNLYFTGYWWSSAQYSSNLAWRWLMTYNSGSVLQNYDTKSTGYAVRCLKDSFLFVYLPILQTDSITGITTNAAFGGGEILDSGGDNITARGLCWNTTGSPTLADSFVVAGSGTGTFTAQLTNLLPGTIYYVRAFATNLVGTGCGNEVEFTTLPDTTGSFICGEQISDYDGNIYNTVLIGTQCWMKENLNTTHDASGNSITRHCYNNETDSCDVYGGLYDWNTLMNGASSSNSVPSGVQGICPSGWHVPSNAEWDTIVNYLGGNYVAGGKMKEAGILHWLSPNTDATNSSGFTALPGGYYHSGSFDFLGSYGHWWSSTQYSSTNAWRRDMYYTSGSVPQFYGNKLHGVALRCLKASFLFVYLPILQTDSITGITTNAAIGGGEILDSGGDSISTRGLCWNTTGSPTLVDSFVVAGSGTGTFTAQLANLLPYSTYYVRAYATNLVGTGFGNEVEFTTLPDTTGSFTCGDQISDYDGNIYNTVLIGTQCWMKENLNTTHDAAGTSITRYCYNNETDSCEVYGGLYDWNALMNGASSSNAVPSGVQGICPIGWHVPSDAEWDTVVAFLGGSSVAGGKMKEAGILHWQSPNTDATNSSGFTALPGGFHSGSSFYYGLGSYGIWWSSTQYSSTNAWDQGMDYNIGSVDQYSDYKSFGFAVRCLKASFLFVYLPILQTDSITGITTNAAFGGGEILDSGGDSISARGLCWNTTGSPSLADSFIVAGSGTGTFTAQLTNLLPGTIYYVRAFATNLVGTGYGNEVQFITTMDCIQPPYMENFVDTIFPTGWFQESLATDGGWLLGDSASLSSPAFHIPSNGNFIATNDDGCDCDKSSDFLISPCIDISGSSHPELSFDLYFRKLTYLSVTESLTLNISTDGGLSWTEIDSLDGGESWRTEHFDLSSYISYGDIKISLKYSDGNGWLFGCALDNFSVKDTLLLDAVTTQVSCIPGAIDVTVINGTTPFSFIWSNGATSEDISTTQPGAYSVTVTDVNGITGVGNFEIAENYLALEYQTTGSISGGNTGGIVIFAAGGTPPYTVVWSSGDTTFLISNLSIGQYTVTVSDINSCSLTETITIGEQTAYLPKLPLIEQFTSGNTTCGYCCLYEQGFQNEVLPLVNYCTVIEYPNSWYPDGYQTNESESRYTFYNVSAIPNASFNGAAPFHSNNITSSLITNSYCSDTTAVSIISHYAVMDSTIEVNVDVHTVDSIVNSNLVLQVAIVENETFNNVTCSQVGSNIFVMKKMLPDQDGTLISSLQPGVTNNYTFTYTFPAGNTVEEFSDLSVVVFVQDNSTHEVLQSAWAVSVSSPPAADFQANITTGYAPLEVAFSDLSTGTPLEWLWFFGDGTTSTVQNPVHTYPSIDNYTVSLVASNFIGSDIAIYQNYIQVLDSIPSVPAWTYTNTGSSHTILIQGATPITIDSTQIIQGDYIGVFYDSSGTEACAGYGEWTGQGFAINAWGDDAQSLEPDGFATGETFKWKIWRASDDTVFDATATYMQPPIMPNTDTYVTNGMSGLISLEAITVYYQYINLPQGWSIFSHYVDPFEANIDSLCAPFVNEVIICKDGDGNTYWPQWGLNFIGDLLIGDGYQIKMNTAQTMTVAGIAVSPENTTITIDQGWSFLGYIRQSAAPITTMLSPVVSEIIIVKNGAGLIYWPQWGINMIGDMVPGEGYQIKMGSQQTITYPANSVVFTKQAILHVRPIHYYLNKNTGNNMSLGVITTDIERGSEIGVFTPSGMLIGSSVVTGNFTSVTLWGDDETTPEIDGLSNNENFIIRLWNGEERVIEVNSWLEGGGNFETNKIAVVGNITGNLQTTNVILFQNIPNPFTSETEFSFYIPEKTNIKFVIMNMLGETINVLISEEMESGLHRYLYQTQNLPAGSYYYRLETNEFSETKKMVIVK